MSLLEEFEKSQMKKTTPVFNVGDTLDVHVRIVEGDKQRVQVFTGTVIARKGGAHRESFTVRRIVAGEGVERVFPLHSPWIEQIRVRRHGKVRRAKLYYLRARVGKATKVKERMDYERRRKQGAPARRRVRKDGSSAASSTPEEAQPVGSVQGT